MPYIKQTDRERLVMGFPMTPGELNYDLTRQVVRYLGKEPNYAKFNEVVGVLECIKQELYRRMIAPYEDKKKAENGDVYP